MSPQLAAIFAFLRRFLFAVVCTLVIATGGVAAWLLSHDVDEQELVRQERAREGEAMLDLLVGGTAQRQELEVVREAARRIDDNLVLESDLAGNNWYFYKLEEQTRCRLLENRQQSAAGNEHSPLFKRIPWTLRLVGSYQQVAGYLLALETGPRLVRVTAFSLSRNSAGAGAVASPNVLSMELSVELLGKK
jgi:Tfp pilus assembly protein PilO